VNRAAAPQPVPIFKGKNADDHLFHRISDGRYADPASFISILTQP